MGKGNMGNILKQAQQMQQRVSMLQKELEERELEVSSAGDAVKITINGKQEILSLKINPECIDPSDPEMLEEIVKTAANKAVKESQDMVSSAMSKVTGGLNIPGLF